MGKNYDKYLNPPNEPRFIPEVGGKKHKKTKRVFLKLGPPTLKPFGRLSTTPGFWLRCRKVWYQDGSMMAIPLLSRFATGPRKTGPSGLFHMP